MEEIAFSDWPGQPVDLNAGNNPWLPAYGFQTPSALLEKEDFIGNPDAEYFLQNNIGHYMYLETIQEETSDDLRSDSSDLASRNGSPVGWLATDSEAGSVICIEHNNATDDCDSDREVACPAKRRRHDNFLGVPAPSDSSEDAQSISRSSSLLAFETLEKECQETSTCSSPLAQSQYHQFSFEQQQFGVVQPPKCLRNSNSFNEADGDGDGEDEDDDEEEEVEYYRMLKVDKEQRLRSRSSVKENNSNDSLLNPFEDSNSDSSDETVTRSFDNFEQFHSLKPWRSFDNLQEEKKRKRRASVENLSEDSGYCDRGSTANSTIKTGGYIKNPNLNKVKQSTMLNNSHVKSFAAYDGDFFAHFQGNFGVSYQDLSIFDDANIYYTPLIERFRSLKRSGSSDKLKIPTSVSEVEKQQTSLKIVQETSTTTTWASKYKFSGNVCESAPSLLLLDATNAEQFSPVSTGEICSTSASVPDYLNLIGETDQAGASIAYSSSVASKNIDLGDIGSDENSAVVLNGFSGDTMAAKGKYKREPSYDKAMNNRVDLSDDESSLCYRKKLPNTPIVEFDRRVLKAISETSLQSQLSVNLLHSQGNLNYWNSDTCSCHSHMSSSTTNIPVTSTPKQRRQQQQQLSHVAAVSTPNLALMRPYPEEERRKSVQEFSAGLSILTDKPKDELKQNVLKEQGDNGIGQEKKMKPEVIEELKQKLSQDRKHLEQLEQQRNLKLIETERQPNSIRLEKEKISTRRDSIIKSSTSASESDPNDTKTQAPSVESFGSNNSSTPKEVHFSPIVSEVKWKEDSVDSASTLTPERESSFSIASSPERDVTPTLPVMMRPKPRRPTPISKRVRSVSQPDLSDNENSKKEFIDSLKSLQKEDLSKSQPEISKFKRRGSQLIKKDRDGCIIKAYVDSDGIQYKHTHLDLDLFHSGSGSNASVATQHAPIASAAVSQPALNRTISNSSSSFHQQPQNKLEFCGARERPLSTSSGNILLSRGDRERVGPAGGGGGVAAASFRNSFSTAAFGGSSCSSFSGTSNYLNSSGGDAGGGYSGTVLRSPSQQQQSHTMIRNNANANDGPTNGSSNKAKKLGGFFSRLASFRFSLRREKDDKNRKNKGKGGPNQTETTETHQLLAPNQKIATKADYIYIPLKAPNNDNSSANNNVNSNSNSGKLLATKPPLPKQPPPRVVHASVKSGVIGGGGGYGAAPNSNLLGHGVNNNFGGPQRPARRRTIDSCCSGGGGAGGCCGAGGLPMEPMGLIETDLDTEVTVITSSNNNIKTRSLLNLGNTESARYLTPGCARGGARGVEGGGDDGDDVDRCCRQTGRPHKSMEFLLDKQNLKVVEPPENDLQKGGERVMSEHQLRVQRSLQKLTVPEWYKQAQIPREGFLLHKHQKQRPSWTGTTSAAGSKTTSLSSLTSSPLVLSPTPTSQPFVRWSTSKLNSTASSPCASTRSSFNASSSCRQPNGSISPSSLRSSFTYRQPYMGWRSQERLTRPRTPAERLASSILQQQDQQNHHQSNNLNHQQESPEIQTSIKEVTSAIVHYVSGLRPEDISDPYERQQRSPRGSQKLCWLESSFVGTKPLDSPQTPVTIADSGPTTNKPPSGWRLDLQSSHNDMTLLLSNTTTVDGGSSSTASNENFDSASSAAAVGGGSSSNLNILNNTKPSPGSTTLEDVLDSLLGLPSSGRAPSPSLQGRRPVDGIS